jgi:hypothetical protein
MRSRRSLLPYSLPTAVLLLLLLPGFSVSLAGSSSLSLTAPLGHAPVRAAAQSAPTPAASPLGSSEGFYSSRTLPQAPVANRTCALTGTGTGCPSGYLLNVTNDVAMNYTTTGVLAVAFTSFSNEVPCPAAAPYVQSVVSLLVSSNNGSTWSAPRYLSNPDCASAATFPSAWQPALTSLSNGTLVLAYVEYNSTSILPFFSPYSPPLTRLVLTESYDGGANWTVPRVLNSSVTPTLSGVVFPELLPSLSAVGRTIYLSWMTLAVYGGFGFSTPSQVALLVSTNGGRFWSPVLTLADEPYSNAGNPYVLATPSGEVFIAYTQGLLYGPSVLVDSSTDNFTSFATNTIASSLLAIQLTGPFSAPAPRLAFAAGTGVLYATFVDGAYNAKGRLFAHPSLFSSTDGGVSWSASTTIQKLFFNPVKAAQTGRYGNPYTDTGVYDIEPAVTANGTLELEALYMNDTLCWKGSCGYLAEYAASTADRGASFAGPYLLNGSLSPNDTGWPGEYGAVVASGTHLWFGAGVESCPSAPSTRCGFYPSAPITTTQVMLAEPENGTGVSIQFSASGLNSTETWQVNLLGHVLTGNGTSTLQFSGLPPGEPAFWSIPGLNVTSSLREYVVSQSTYPILSPSGNLTDVVGFAGFVPLTVNASPASLFRNALPPACLQVYSYYNQWDATIQCANINLSPYAPGATHWVEQGIALQLNASTWDPLYTDCFAHSSASYVYCSISITNFTFLSWSGTGTGSVNSSGMNVTLRPMGAITEVANFLETGSCTGYYQSYGGRVYNYVSCGRFTVPLGFTEKGLPSGTPWGVSLSGAEGNFTNESTSTGLVFPSVPTASAFTVTLWTVPTATPGRYWVGNSSLGTTIVTPVLGPIPVEYSLQSIGGSSFPVAVSEVGLPAGTDWSYTVNRSGGGGSHTYGATGTTSELSLAAGLTYTLSATFLPTTTGAGYEAGVASYGVATVNGTYTVNGSAPAVLNLSGAGNVSFLFSEAWWLDVASSGGGTVSPGSAWVGNDSAVVLTASPAANDEFVGWTGFGPGSNSAGQRHQDPLLLRPVGPVRELATFAPRPPPTFSLEVNSTGLPANQPFTLELGASAYSGAGSFTVRNLSGADYSVGVPFAYSIDSLGVRYLPVSNTSSLPFSSGVLSLYSNGSFTIDFSTQYLLTVLAGPGGTVSPSGAGWQGAGAQATITASPDNGFRLLGWNGTGSGARTGSASSLVLVMGGPISETAEFVKLAPPAPRTYSLFVHESGLPPNTGWNLSVGSGSAGGSGSSLIVAGLNGSFEVTVPIVAPTAGVRFVPAAAGLYPVNLSASDANLSVQFSEQVLLTVTVTGSGSAGPSSAWVAEGVPAQLEATPGSGARFLGWAGSGSGSYSGSSAEADITPTGPVVEVASFGPVPGPSSTGSSSAGRTNALLLWGVAGAVAVAAVLAAALLARRRPPAQAESEPEPEPWIEEDGMTGEGPSPDAQPTLSEG